MSGNLAAHSVGVLLMGVHNLYKEDGDDKVSLYCCTHLEYSLGINELPTITATIGMGSPISGKEATKKNTDGSLSDLLSMGMQRRTTASKFLRCSFYEADNDGTWKAAIFRGHIISVSEVIKTASGHLKALRVMCMGIGAMLHISPLAGYRRTNSSILVEGASGSMEAPTAGAMNTSVIEPYTALQNTTEDELCDVYADSLLSCDILTKAALLASVIAAMGEVTNGEGADFVEVPDDELLGIKKCIFCDYYLDKTEMHADAEVGFDTYLGRQLITTLQQTSVLDSLVTTLTGMDVMMNLVPHFVLGGHADDFRMELRPIDAWNAVDVITIPNKNVVECNTSMNYMAHLNDPDVLVVDYSSGAGSADGSKTSGEATGCFGVYSTNKDIMRWAKYRYTGSKEQEAAAQKIEGLSPKVRYANAPVWLDFSMLNQLQGSTTVKMPKFTPQNDNEAKGGNKTAQENDEIRAGIIADQIAKAMYLYLHGASDVALFQLTTDVRFGLNDSIGCLENHIGKTIDIFGYRGILKQIRYVYASGQSTNNSYTITLDRVRKRDTKEPKITCPLYRKGEHDSSLTGNNELWADTAKQRSAFQKRTAEQEAAREEQLNQNVTNALDAFFGDLDDALPSEDEWRAQMQKQYATQEQLDDLKSTVAHAKAVLAAAEAEAAANGGNVAQAVVSAIADAGYDKVRRYR